MAPSQLRLAVSKPPTDSKFTAINRHSAEEDMTTIQTMPLFGFLSIPDAMKRQFKVPSGCEITERSIALRKIKTLGGRKSFQPLLPSGHAMFKRLTPPLIESAIVEVICYDYIL